MIQRKHYDSQAATSFYIVKFTAAENIYFAGIDNVLQHTAKVVRIGNIWYKVTGIDGRPASSVCFASPKTAAKNAYFLK